MHTSTLYSHYRRREHAYTLVEVVIVLCLLSLVAAISVRGAASILRKEIVSGSATDLSELHHWAVRHTRPGKPVEMTFDFETSKVVVSDGQRGVRFPPGTNLKWLLIDGAILETGMVSVEYVHAKLPTYAICIELERGLQRWHVVCGPSGSVETFVLKNGGRDAIAGWLATWANAD